MHLLLNPGPVSLSDRVRSAMNKPDICHREIEFTRLQSNIRRKLLGVYGLDDSWAAVIFTGSGTSAIEAMLTSIIGNNDKVLVIENGLYGERLSDICRIYEINYTSVHHLWDERIDMDRIKAHLTPDTSFIVVVHHETTTGRLNDLEPVAECAAETGAQLLVDGVSSFGAEELRFSDWNIAACTGTANKCLHGVPGISFVIFNRTLSGRLESNHRTLYLDLGAYLAHQDNDSIPFTQSVQVMYALDAALDEHLEEGGWKARKSMYSKKMAIVHEGMRLLGIKPLLEQSEFSSVLQSFRLPDGIRYFELHDELKDHGYIIYAGQGELAESIFRISMMGAITEDDAVRFVAAVKEIIGNCNANKQS